MDCYTPQDDEISWSPAEYIARWFVSDLATTCEVWCVRGTPRFIKAIIRFRGEIEPKPTPRWTERRTMVHGGTEYEITYRYCWAIDTWTEQEWHDAAVDGLNPFRSRIIGCTRKAACCV